MRRFQILFRYVCRVAWIMFCMVGVEDSFNGFDFFFVKWMKTFLTGNDEDLFLVGG